MTVAIAASLVLTSHSFAETHATGTATPTAEQTSSPEPTAPPPAPPPASSAPPQAYEPPPDNPEPYLPYYEPPVSRIAPPFSDSSREDTPPVEYMTMEEVGLLREMRSPDSPGPLDESGSNEHADQPFRVLGEPWMPAPAAPTTGRTPFLDIPLGTQVTNLLLAVALLGVVLIPILALLARFVNGQPIFGCEIKPLASKQCRPDYRRMSPA